MVSILGRSSTIVTFVPKDANIFANSEPTTPPPTIRSDFGSFFRDRIPIFSIMPSCDRSNGGTLFADEPVDMMILSAFTTVFLPSDVLTVRVLPELSLPSPFISSIPFFLK